MKTTTSIFLLTTGLLAGLQAFAPPVNPATTLAAVFAGSLAGWTFSRVNRRILPLPLPERRPEPVARPAGCVPTRAVGEVAA